jgi:serine protease Do
MATSKLPTTTLYRWDFDLSSILRKAICLLIAQLTFCICVSAQTVSPTDSLRRMDAAVDALIKKVSPSVVQIQVIGYGELSEKGRGNTGAVVGQQHEIGSGFVIDSEGYIVTNAHVVNGAHRVQVLLPNPEPGGSLPAALSARTNLVTARIVGIAPDMDLALLKIEGIRLPALKLATYRDIRQGQTVFAFGSPEGLRNSVTHGMISSVARQLDSDSPMIYVQTDAPINPGNSGGPLVNLDGEVVGVNTFIITNSGGNEGLGFAIPCATVRTLSRQLKETGHLRHWEIGIGMQTITPLMAAGLGLPRNYGVVVSDVTPGSPAEAAGLMVNDILISIDGLSADDVPSVSYFFVLGDFGEKVKVVVLRKSGQETFSVGIVEQNHDLDAVMSLADPNKNLVPALGILGIEVDQKIAAAIPGLRSPSGIIVAGRTAGAAAEIPLVIGDIIRSLNGQPTTSLEGLRAALKAIAAGSPATLQIQRDGKLLYVAFTLD